MRDLWDGFLGFEGLGLGFFGVGIEIDLILLDWERYGGV